MLLAVDTWDLCLDANGNWAVAEAPYQLAQDGSSAIRTFLGEVWYDKTLGIPYKTNVQGQNPPLTVLQEYMVNVVVNQSTPSNADVTIESAQCIVTSFDRETRKVEGQVQFVDSDGIPGVINA